MRWVKWRQHWCHSIEDWKYTEIPEGYDMTNFGEYLDHRGCLGNFSDKWRKVEWVRVYRLPKKEYQKQLKYIAERAEDAQKKLAIGV